MGHTTTLGQDRATHAARPPLLGGQDLVLDVCLDKSMVEAYANGYKSLTSRVYPSRDDALGLQLFADGPAQVKSLRVWQMGGAFSAPS